MKLKILKICLIIISCLFCVALLAVSIWAIVKNGIDYIGIMSGISSVVLSLLTALYVYTTSKQIDAVNKQIEEMKMDRITKEQPLLSIVEDKFTIESPNFYYTPPTNEYSFQSRYYYKFKINNESNYSAILIDLDAELLINLSGKLLRLGTCNKRINTLAANKDSKELHFMFAGDEELRIFSALREQSVEALPILRLTLIYKNLNGGHFKIHYKSILAPHKENEEIIRKWQKAIVSAESDSKEIVVTMSNMNSDDEKRDKIFDKIKGLFKKEVGEEEIEIRIIHIDEEYSISLISKEEYEQEMAGHSYPRFIHKNKICKSKIINYDQL